MNFQNLKIGLLSHCASRWKKKVVSVSRARGTVKFPAHFILVAAMNPCPCGNFGIKGKPCSCAPLQIERYKRKISGPLLTALIFGQKFQKWIMKN